MRTLLLALGAVAVAEEKRISREIIRDALPLVLARSESLLPYIARYEEQIAELFHAEPYSFQFRDLPGLWH